MLRLVCSNNRLPVCSGQRFHIQIRELDHRAWAGVRRADIAPLLFRRPRLRRLLADLLVLLLPFCLPFIMLRLGRVCIYWVWRRFPFQILPGVCSSTPLHLLLAWWQERR